MGVYTQPCRSDELYHYGVMGMKWGVRRYQNYDGSWKPNGEKHRYTMSNRMDDWKSRRKIAKTNRKQLKSKIKSNVKNANGIVNKYHAAFGRQYKEEANRSAQKTLQQQAKYVKNDSRAANMERRARNAGYVADYWRDSRKRGELVNLGMEVSGMDPGVWSIKYERKSGRTTTLGKEILNYSLTYGLAGAALDIKYTKNKNASDKKQ